MMRRRINFRSLNIAATLREISLRLRRLAAPALQWLPEKWRDSPWTHSVLLHMLLLLLLFSGGIWWPSEPVSEQAQPVIRAHAVDEAQVQEAMQQLRERERAAEDARRKAVEQTKREQQRLAELKKQRAEEQKKLAAEKKARQQAEKKRLALERAAKDKAEKEKAEKAEMARKQKEAEEKQADEQKKLEEQKQLEAKKAEEKRKADEKAARERELQNAMQAEESARAQAAKETAWLTVSQQIQLQIQNKVRGKWQRPAAVPETAQVILRVSLLPDGSVQSVELRKESGVTLFDQSALRAVQAASPLPIPEDRELFDAQFRQFEFTFTAAE
jgi:colicin import membrane protein